MTRRPLPGATLRAVPDGARVACTACRVFWTLRAVPRGAWAPGGHPLATDADAIPFFNIPCHGHCRTMDGPCAPALAPRWTVPTPTPSLGPGRLLTENAFLPCARGGVLRIVDPGHSTVSVGRRGGR